MVVSHRVDHGTQAALHEETALPHDDKGVQKFIKNPADATKLVAVEHHQGNVKHTNYYAHGGIHHIDFWLVKEKNKNGTLKEHVKGVPVYIHEAHPPKGQKPKQTRPHPAAKLIMRLHKGDSLIIDTPKTKDTLVSIKAINPSQSRFIYQTPNQPASKEKGAKLEAIGFVSLLKFNTRKAFVDVLGNIKSTKRKL